MHTSRQSWCKSLLIMGDAGTFGEFAVHECISENCLSHKNATHVQSSRTSEI